VIYTTLSTYQEQQLRQLQLTECADVGSPGTFVIHWSMFFEESAVPQGLYVALQDLPPFEVSQSEMVPKL
jgi:hypothetical protein